MDPDPDPATQINADPDPQPCFSSVTFKMPIKITFFDNYFLKVHLHHSSKINSHKEVNKKWKSRFFLLFLLDDGKIRIRIHNTGFLSKFATLVQPTVQEDKTNVPT
jgi:hypothetical protein